MAEHLWDSGLAREDDFELARKLRDRVRRALSGAVLTRATLDQISGAFAFAADDRARLLALLEGSAGARGVTGLGLLPRRTLPEHRHVTVQIEEHHYLGIDGRPKCHETAHVIEAGVEGLDLYPYIFDTNSLTIDVTHGGVVAEQITGLPDGLHGVTIALTTPLSLGETTKLRYVTTFAYPEPPAPEFRRAVNSRAGSTTICIQFDPQRLPETVYWCTWPDLDGEPEINEIVPLAPDNTVQKWLPFMEGTCVGFRWDWRP